MTNREIENKVKTAFTRAEPDVLDSVLSDCKNQKGKVIMITETKKKPYRLRQIAAAAAVFLLLVFGASGIYRLNYAVASTVSLDVNPSIEIQVNQKNTVLRVTALNEDGKIVIGNMDFKGSKLDVTVNALIGSMLRNGYLTELANSILVSVTSSDPAKSAELQAQLTEEINALLRTDTFEGAVLSQTVSSDAALQQLADSYGITTGKAQLIQQLITQNPLHTFEELVPLSINELNLLCKSGSVPLDSMNSVGTASDKAYIGEEKAKELALAHAGVTADAIYKYEFEMDYDHGVMIYEIEFSCDGYEYSYDINASTGAVVKQEKERDDDRHHQTSDETGNGNNPPSSSESISEADAKEIALSHAGLTSDNISRYKCELDYEDHTLVYEIEFRSGGYEYSYDIDASTGAIVKYEKERD